MIEEGQITSMCVEEHKLMGEVNNPPNWHRLETTTFYQNYIFKLLSGLNFSFLKAQDLAEEMLLFGVVCDNRKQQY